MAAVIDRMRERFSWPFNKGGVIRLLEPFATRYALTYLVFTAGIAIVGYVLLLFFPLLAINMALNLPENISAAHNLKDWLAIVAMLLIMIAAGAFSVPLFRLKFPRTEGLELNQDTAPRLFKLINELRQEFKQPVIDQVIVQNRFAIDVVKTPRLGLPFFNHTTLIIGLPALQCLPPLHFKGLLARRLGQISGGHNRLSHWLYSLRSVWPHYRGLFKTQPGFLAKPFYILFMLYAPVYNTLAFYAARKDELEADRYALDIINDDDLSAIFSQLIVTESFLNKKYWPKIRQLARRNNQPQYLPHANMVKVLRSGLSKEDMQAWINQAFDTFSDTKDFMPPLRMRLENIAHDIPASPVVLQETAAEYYVDARILKKVIEKFDQRWLKHLQRR